MSAYHLLQHIVLKSVHLPTKLPDLLEKNILKIMNHHQADVFSEAFPFGQKPES